MHMHEIVLFCSVLFGFERSLCIFIRVCQIDPNQRFHFKGACGQTNGSYIHTPNDLLQKLFIEEKGKVCIHVSVMCMSTTHLAMCLCSSAGRRMERFCAFLLAPTVLADLYAVISNAGGERRPVGRGAAGRRVWSRRLPAVLVLVLPLP